MDQALGFPAACGSIQGNDVRGPNTQGPQSGASSPQRGELIASHFPSARSSFTSLFHDVVALLTCTPCIPVALTTVTDAPIIAQHHGSEIRPLHSFPGPPRQPEHCAGLCLFSWSWLASTGSVHLTPKRSVQRL